MEPVYSNDCKHRRENFQGQVKMKNGLIADLYIYPSNIAGIYEEYGELHYCLRFGPNGDYCSGPIRNLFD